MYGIALCGAGSISIPTHTHTMTTNSITFHQPHVVEEIFRNFAKWMDENPEEWEDQAWADSWEDETDEENVVVMEEVMTTSHTCGTVKEIKLSNNKYGVCED